ncbi:TPA: glycosyltransferase family 4 protein [Elizabethkingia anophelis]
MNKIKNVLILTKEYQHSNLPNVGGTGVFYKNLSQMLSERGIQVSVFLITKNKIELNDNGINIFAVKDVFKSNKILELARSISGKSPLFNYFNKKIYLLEKKIIAKKLKEWIVSLPYTFDIAETHDFDGLALAIPNNIPYTIRCHGSWSILKKYFGYKNVPMGRIFSEEIAINKSKHNITISKYNEKINKELFNINNSRLIYNGIDLSFFHPILPREIIPQSIFYIGNVSKEKGAETILESFRKIKVKFSKCTLHFVGKANNYENIVKQEKLEIQNSIHFYGHKNPSELVALVNVADIVCFPSEGENFSLSLLEVMAMQKPIICSNIGAFTEIIEDSKNGFIAKNSLEFAEKIEILFKNEQLKKVISLEARKTVNKKFSLERMLNETITYYKEII